MASVDEPRACFLAGRNAGDDDELPEIVAVSITAGSEACCQWINESPA